MSALIYAPMRICGGIVSILLLGATASGQATAPAPEGAQLRVYLMTMGPGDAVWERFGHNALWIHDPLNNTDNAYNYGMFSFTPEAPLYFIYQFLRGKMNYWVEPFDAHRMADAYAAANRQVWVQELNLSPQQRKRLNELLEWNAQPQNRFYRYDYYHDNCSTRLRDALDRALEGQLQRQLQFASGSTYRSHTRIAMADNLFWYTCLYFVLGQPVDRPITAWEESFLPMEMMEHLRGAKVRDEQGNEVPLVKYELTAFPSTRAPLPEIPPQRLGGYLAAGVVLGTAFGLLARGAPTRRDARIALAVLSVAWAILLSFAGCMLLWGWTFSDHWAVRYNENMLFMNPVALPLVVLLAMLPFTPRGTRVTLAIVLFIAGASVLGLIVQVLPGFSQVNGEIIALALPANLGLALAVVRMRRPTAAGGRGFTD